VRIEIAGPIGKLSGELEEPEGAPRAVAVVCHPHPLHGGTMRNTLVVRTARALRTAGFATVRFDFRGVEESEGVHDGAAEVEDAAAALSLLRARFPGLPSWAGGFSFGSRIAAELAARGTGVERVVLVAFPSRITAPDVLVRMQRPGLLVLAGADRFGSAADLRRRLPELPATLEVVEVPEADHFFRGRTPLVEEAVLRYARAALDGTPP
jgi:alpha/beta superfamily hydrolase